MAEKLWFMLFTYKFYEITKH